jgi:hypothetical protein
MLDRNVTTTLALRPTISPSVENVMGALRGAADRTGADFDYLLTTAMRESSLNPAAKASTSSATGLFQFIEQTWLGTMRRHGGAHGLSAYADAIKPGKDGRLTVADKGLRQEILALRKDPAVAALMAGELTNDMRSTLEGSLGRGVSAGELYIAHFLGPQAAVKLIRAGSENPALPAASLFPDAAAANASIFYGKGGQARPVSDVLASLKAKHDVNAGEIRFAARDVAKQNPAVPARADKPASAPEAATAPLSPQSQGSFAASLAMDGMVLSPLLAQILASVDTLPGFDRVFSPIDETSEDSRRA